LITITVLLLNQIIFKMSHGAFLDLSGFADNAAEDADEALRAERAGILMANPLQDLLFAPAVEDGQAGRFLDRRQFAGYSRALVKQAQQLGVQDVDFLAALVKGRVSVASVFSHRLSPKSKSRDPGVAACGIYDVLLISACHSHTIRYAATLKK